jgi:anti-sigma factor RsiW
MVGQDGVNRTAGRHGVEDSENRHAANFGGPQDSAAQTGRRMGPQQTGGGAHVVDRLESYLLGDLSTDTEFDVEEHLLRCPECRAECDRMSGVALLVAGLPEPAVEESARPPLRVVPGGRTDPPPAPAKQRPERRTRLLVAAAALVLGIVVGSAGWALFAPQSLQSMLVGNSAPPVDLAGRVTLTIEDGPDGAAQVTAVVVGLPPGASFTLLAVTADTSHVVVRDQAGGGPQRLVGTVPVPADRILLVVAALDDGTVVAIGLP